MLDAPETSRSAPVRRARTLPWVGMVAAGVVLGWLFSILLGLGPFSAPEAPADWSIRWGTASGPGIPYRVQVELHEEGLPILVHLDADGLPSLLFPPGQPVYAPAREPFFLPGPDPGLQWWIDPTARGQVLLLAIAHDGRIDPEQIVREAAEAAAGAEDTASARRAVVRTLRRRLGGVSRLPLEPAPTGSGEPSPLLG